MSAANVLAAGRRTAEARMLSRATVRRKTGATTTASNGRKVPAWDDVHTDLPARVAGTAARTPARHRNLNVGGAEISESSRVLHFPAATTDLRDGDLVEITAGELTGAVFQIIEADWQDQATARRVPAVATERPEEW